MFPMFPLPDLSEYQQPEFIQNEYKKKHKNNKINAIVGIIFLIATFPLAILAFEDLWYFGFFLPGMFLPFPIIAYFSNKKYRSMEYLKKEIAENHLKKRI